MRSDFEIAERLVSNRQVRYAPLRAQLRTVHRARSRQGELKGAARGYARLLDLLNSAEFQTRALRRELKGSRLKIEFAGAGDLTRIAVDGERRNLNVASGHFSLSMNTRHRFVIESPFIHLDPARAVEIAQRSIGVKLSAEFAFQRRMCSEH